MLNFLQEYWPFLLLAIWVYIVERREVKLSQRVDWLQGEIARLKAKHSVTEE
jgi:hypothetical protein